MKTLGTLILTILALSVFGQNSVEKQLKKADLLYELELNAAGITEFGVSFNELMAGKATIPPEGARFDFAFEGTVNGPRIKGTVKGVDYLSMRADGRTELNVYFNITTEGGKNISVHAGGISMPRPGTAMIDLREDHMLFTSEEDYKWVNGLQVWSTGTVDLEKGEIKVYAYSAN